MEHHHVQQMNTSPSSRAEPATRSDIELVRKDIDVLRTELKGEMQVANSELKGEIQALQAGISSMVTTILVIAAIFGALMTILKIMAWKEKKQ